MPVNISRRAGLRICIVLTALALFSPLHAWDATGHRLSVYVAYHSLTQTQREYWHDVLQHHPRFDTDFERAMPDAIAAASRDEQTRWLLGQAAVWPDLARGLPEAIRPRFNQPDWHWIDGAWVRDQAATQGNLYVDTRPLPDIAGAPADNSRFATHASNVLTALERARWQLEHETDAAQRAIALCWLLHLIGDIHQPLHTGGLVSATLFPAGDRGGNAIRTRGGNLHAAWDRALRGPELNDSLTALNRRAVGLAGQQAFTPTTWLHESRSILLRQVYPSSVIANVRRSEKTDDRLGSTTLSSRYQDNMKQTASIRIAEAGVRISSTLTDITGTL
jgi:hypothetical protein